ncbi:hypothetical protein P280DRAFT_515473 [Massarina eburnea CBS 473.64]|uniref:Wax synthase domain-containing protein n=1 Tax=Massarina eburnea CBS 473.64 TaxID=1395130 RepID=A0A6A6S579_9PLEO|nr:hypothetical protein P280DRAFT_515473 [Massarina eburnea CBS 473.64]
MSVLLVSAYGAFITSHNLSPDDTFNEIYTRYILIGSSHILSMAYKNNGSREVPNNLDHKDAKPTWNPWYRGWKLLFNIRGVGTPWEPPYLWPGIKYTWIAPKSSEDLQKKIQDDKPVMIASHNLTTRGKWAGIAIRCGYLLMKFFLLTLYYEYMKLDNLLDSPTSPSDFARDKEGIIRRLLQTYILRSEPRTPVAKRELEIRAWKAFENQTASVLLLSSYHDFFAIFFIAVGLDESWEWPPFYGQIWQAWTMRRYWTMYWHRVIYRSFNSHVKLITDALGISSRTPLTRILQSFMVFGMSAVMHDMVTAHYGGQCAETYELFGVDRASTWYSQLLVIEY